MSRKKLRVRGALAAALVVGPTALCAQGGPGAAGAAPGLAGGRSEVFVGSELEGYLRYLQTLGASGPYPWSIRGFSPQEVDRLSPTGGIGPWAERYDLAPGTASRWDVVRPAATAAYNSRFPYGSNDGAVWAGRGLTTAVRAGVAARWRGVSLTLAPVAFWAENRPFALQPNGKDGRLAFADPRYPENVDRPQRFGDRAYARLDPGQSTLRVDAHGVAAGASTANEALGPASVYPFILGPNAPGFPHAFLGTARPVDLWLARLHARVLYGQLSQSEYTDITGRNRLRLASGLVVTLQPRGLPNLELGAARFYHSAWRPGGPSWADVRKPFQAFTKSSVGSTPDDSGGPDNQLASVFFRWVLPRSGFELYSELGRDDHSYDLRDLVLEPDHAASVMWGFRKAWRRPSGAITALRAEAIDFERPHEYTRRGGGDIYVHGRWRQGHTQRGQLLGADVGVGSAAGMTVAVDHLTRGGRWTAWWARDLRQEAGQYAFDSTRTSRDMDVAHTLGLERLLFAGPADITVGLAGVYELNRAMRADEFNASFTVGIRTALRGLRPAAR